MTVDKIKQRAAFSDHIRTVLAEGSTAVLVTVIESRDLKTGAKLLAKSSGETAGDLGDPKLNEAAVREGARFLTLRADARSSNVSEFAADLALLSDSIVLFERIEKEPRLVVAGAGHVGASLARLASLVVYRVTLIDDRAEFVARELFTEPSEREIKLVAAESWFDELRDAIENGRAVSWRSLHAVTSRMKIVCELRCLLTLITLHDRQQTPHKYRAG